MATPIDQILEAARRAAGIAGFSDVVTAVGHAVDRETRLADVLIGLSKGDASALTTYDPFNSADMAAVTGGVPKTLAQKAYMDALVSASGVVFWLQDGVSRARIHADADGVMAEIRKIPLSEFRTAWSVARNFTNLQGRLYLEQLFTLMGEGYSDLVTGFKPAKP